MRGHSEHCGDRRCRGCDDSDFDPDRIECRECGENVLLSECEEGETSSYLVCPECGEDIYVGSYDSDERVVQRAEAGYPDA